MTDSLDSCLQTTVVILLMNCHGRNRWKDLVVWLCVPEAVGGSSIPAGGGRLLNGDAQTREEEGVASKLTALLQSLTDQCKLSVRLSLKRTQPKPQLLFSS